MTSFTANIHIRYSELAGVMKTIHDEVKIDGKTRGMFALISVN